MGKAIATSGHSVTDATQSQLQLSFASAEDLAAHNPQYAEQITSAAQSSFLDGANWAYFAAMVAIVVGMSLVFFFFPKKDEEEALRAGYHASDSAATEKPPQAQMPAPAPAGADV